VSLRTTFASPGELHTARARTPRQGAATLVALLWFPVAVLAASLEEGLAAYTAGNHALAFEILEDLALDGNPQALLLAGKMLERGEGTPVDLEEAARFYREAAVRGNPEAQNLLGLAYQAGRGLSSDDREAVRWFTAAAKQGSEEARFNLAEALRQGRGVEPDPDAAVALLRAGAAAGYAPAVAAMSELYEAGQRGTEGALPLSSYRKAAQEGDTNAQVQLAYLYDTGKRVEEDPRAARELYAESALHGSADAQANLGRMLQQGRGGNADPAMALHWYREAAQQGHAGAQNNLGMAYLLGDGVERDDQIALDWFQRAARQDNPYALNNIGHMRLKGRAGPVDDDAALKLFREAAKHELPQAQTNIGFAYLRGRGVAKDPVAARSWFEKAAQQDYAPAIGNLGYLYQEGLGVTRDRDRALALYRRAADGDYPYAMRNLGYMHEYGVGVPQDLLAALGWYRRGAGFDDAPSQEGVDRLCGAHMFAGCGGEIVVLLREDDGKIGKVLVQSQGQELLLDKHFSASRVTAGAGVASVAADQEKLEAIFAQTLAMFPPEVLKYTVYFDSGVAALSRRAQAEVERLLAEALPEIHGRNAVEIEVVGHTDRSGESDDNEQLAVDRAQTVRRALLSGGVEETVMRVSGQGERSPRVPTPDGVASARNRRVEITVR
jgi:TPR repeat protein/outer membrane protein OmpA-like peptidoglycan-associated protein